MSDEAPTGVPDDGHAGDLVSAHLDGELDAATEAWVVAHLGSCADCRRTADEALAAKQWLHSSPPVDGGSVVAGFVARHRATIRTGTAFVGAAAVALGALALTSAVLLPDVVPDVDAMVRAHTSTAALIEGREGSVDGLGRTRAVERVAGHYAAPPAVLGTDVRLSRQAMFDGRDLAVVVYGDGRSSVSVFQQPGSLQWDELPPGSVEVVGRRTVWTREGSPAVMVAEVGDLVVTAVSEDRASITAVIEGLPPKQRSSSWARLHDACMRFAEAFSAR